MNPPRLLQFKPRALAVGLIVSSLTSAKAATTVLFSDNFGADPAPTVTAPTTVINTFGYYTRANSGSSWSFQTATKSGVTMTPNYLETGGSTANGDTIKQWMDNPVTLTNIGDQLVVSFDVDSRAVFNAASALNLKVTLYDSSYTIAANAITGANPFAGKVSGYGYAQTNAGGAIYRYSDYDTTASLGGTPPATAAVPSAIYDQTVHTLTFSVTKASVGATFTFSDGASVVYSYTDETATALTFDTLRLHLPGVATNGFWVDNISATYISAVPEPSSFAIFAGFAVLGVVASRRRR